MTIFQEDIDTVIEIVESSKSKAEILRKMGYPKTGPMYKILNEWAENNSVTLPEAQSPTGLREREDDSKIFVENSSTGNREVKKRLVEMGVPYSCSNEDCPSPSPEWRGQKLTLQLDHINGVSNDNRVENLRFLCPNCHTQTETFGSKNSKNPRRKCFCGNAKLPESKTCRSCADSSKLGKNSKIEWPPLEDLVSKIKETNVLKVSKELGVSDNSIRKHLNRRGIDYKSL